MNALKLTDDELAIVKCALIAMKKNLEMIMDEPIFLNSAESNKENLQTAFVLAESIMKKIELIERNDAEPTIHGKWIETTVRGSYAICCSVCGSENEVITSSNFCPNCGAEMSLEIESDNNEN